jgi:hypothetical protein
MLTDYLPPPQRSTIRALSSRANDACLPRPGGAWLFASAPVWAEAAAAAARSRQTGKRSMLGIVRRPRRGSARRGGSSRAGLSRLGMLADRRASRPSVVIELQAANIACAVEDANNVGLRSSDAEVDVVASVDCKTQARAHVVSGDTKAPCGGQPVQCAYSPRTNRSAAGRQCCRMYA